MVRDITIGQYYPTGSVIHQMDPRVKLFGTFVFLISVFAYKGIVGLAVVTVFLAAIIKISKVPFRYMIKGLRAIIILMLITAAFNLFLTPGEAVFQVWKIKVTEEGIAAAVRMMIRLTYLVLGTSLMTLTTTPNQLTDGLEHALIQRAKAMIPLLVPLFVSAFRRANDLALAMEARCYRGGEGRTKMKPLRYQSMDRTAYLVLAAYLVLLIALRILL